MRAVDWPGLEFKKSLDLDERPLDISHTQVDIKSHLDIVARPKKSQEAPPPAALDFGFLCARLSDIIPNSWDGAALLDKMLSFLRKTQTEQKIHSQRFAILSALRSDLQEEISRRTEAIFREKLRRREIIFKLVSAGDPALNWEMAETLNLTVSKDSQTLRRQNNKDLQLSLFEEVYTEEFNDLEKRAAWYLDEDSAIKWWHRIIERQDFHLQGWQKRKIYPDFLICLKSSPSGAASFSILETKGRHLMGNPDTEYKRRIFELFTEYSQKSIEAGAIELQDQKMTFDIVFQNDWRRGMSKVLY